MRALFDYRKLKKILTERKIRIKDFAVQIGVTERHVQNLLNKNVDVSVAVLYNICHVLDMPMEDMVTLVDDECNESDAR